MIVGGCDFFVKPYIFYFLDCVFAEKIHGRAPDCWGFLWAILRFCWYGQIDLITCAEERGECAEADYRCATCPGGVRAGPRGHGQDQDPRQAATDERAG